MKKCYGEFVCSKCGAIIHQPFTFESNEDIQGKVLHTTCDCGKEVETYIPSTLRDCVMTLAGKGYKMRMFNETTISIVLNMKLDTSSLPELPYEFIYDTTEEQGDIICNERCRYNDFVDLNEEDYRKEAIMNLLDFCRLLPDIGEGKIISKEPIDLSKKED